MHSACRGQRDRMHLFGRNPTSPVNCQPTRPPLPALSQRLPLHPTAAHRTHSAMSDSAQLTRRVHALVDQMAAAMSAAAASSSGQSATTAASVRAHVQAALRSMPAATAKQQALRDHIMQDSVMDEAVQRILDIIASEGAQESAAAAPAPASAAASSLLSSSAYAHSLSALDVTSDAPVADVDAWLSGYLPLMLPSATPVEVRAHLLRSLATQAKSLRSTASVTAFFAHPTVMRVLALAPNDASPDAWQQQLEMQLVLVRSLPLLSACVLPIASLIDAGAAHMSSHKLSGTALRRYQYVQSLLLLEEAKRRARDAWQAEPLRAYVSRVRTVLRCVPHEHVFTVSYSGELMFLQAMINAAKEHAQNDKVAATTAKHSGSAKRARSHSPAAAAHSVPLFHAPAFSALFESLAGEVAAQLCSGCRQEGDVEGELVRWAVLVRSTQSGGLPAAFHSVTRWLQQRVASFPARTIPLSLRPYIHRFGSGVQEISQLWSMTAAVKLTLAHLQKLLVAIDGDLQLFDGEEQASSDDESDAEDDEDDAEGPSNKRAKAEFDSLGVSRSPDSLFFLDTGAAGSGSSTGAAVAMTDAADEDADAAHSVAANMSRILRSIPQAAPDRPTRRGNKQAKAQQEADQDEESSGADAAAAEAEAEAQAEAEQIKEEEKDSMDVDADAEAEADAKAEEEAAAEEEEAVEEEPVAPVKEETKKKGKAKVKKEAESGETAVAPTTASTRTRRATKAK